jgi:Raf kinase inhibitor-like YbhB/YbcL family protein
MELTSSAFSNGGSLPSQYSRFHQDFSPPLTWSGTPAGTKGFTLICDDPDAPAGTWVHWVYYDIPAGVNSLPENIEKIQKPSQGGIQGVNDFGRIGYGGPSPPSGTHRYFFKLYAADSLINLSPGATKQQVLSKLKGHILAEAKIMGKYSR